MKKYSVKEIADLLGENPETVRRWIRDKNLIAVSSIAISFFLGIGGTVITLGSIIASLVTTQYINEKYLGDSKLEPQEMIRLIQREIEHRQNRIKQKKISIVELKK